MWKTTKYAITLLILIVALGSYRVNAHATTEEIPLEPIIQVYCWEVGFEFNVSPTLLMSLVYQESRGTAENLTQITSRKWYSEGIEYCNADEYRTNAYQNIRVCGYYLKKWYDEQGDADSYLIAEMWNEGKETALATHSNTPSAYARSVVDRATEWQELWDAQP